VACWSTKATISQKRVKIEEKLLWRAYRKSQTLFRTVPSRSPTASPSSRLGVRKPTPRLQSLLSQEWLKLGTSNLAGIFTGCIRTQAREKFWRKGSVGISRDGPFFWLPPIISGKGKATNFKFGRYIQRVHPNKSPLKIWENRERGRIQGLSKFYEYPLLSQESVKLRTSNFVRTFLVSIGTLQISRKVAGCIVRTLETFQGTHILGASRGLLCDSSTVLFSKYLKRMVYSPVLW